MKEIKYLTVFLGDEAMALQARGLVNGQLAAGWEIVQTLNLGLGRNEMTNNPQIQILHVMTRDVPEAAKRGRPAKEEAVA